MQSECVVLYEEEEPAELMMRTWWCVLLLYTVFWEMPPANPKTCQTSTPGSSVAYSCRNDEYCIKRNGKSTCSQCISPCTAKKNLKEVLACTPTSNRKCECVPGYYCPSAVTNTCRRDCEPCVNGFTNSTNLNTSCNSYTNCTRLGLKVIKNGSSTMDCVCGPSNKIDEVTPTPRSMYSDLIRPQKQTPRSMYSDLIKPQNQTPGKMTSDLIKPQNQTPGKTTSDLIKPQNQTPGKTTSDLIKPQNQTPGKTTSDLIRPQNQTPGSPKSELIRPQNQTPGNTTSDLIRPQNPTTGSPKSDLVRPQYQTPGNGSVITPDPQSTTTWIFLLLLVVTLCLGACLSFRCRSRAIKTKLEWAGVAIREYPVFSRVSSGSDVEAAEPVSIASEPVPDHVQRQGSFPGQNQQVTMDHVGKADGINNTVGSIFIYSPGMVILGSNSNEKKEEAETTGEDVGEGTRLMSVPQQESSSGEAPIRLATQEELSKELSIPVPATSK